MNRWHEGTISAPNASNDKRIAHYWVKAAAEDQEYGMGRIIKLEIKIDGKTVVNYDRGWDIEVPEDDALLTWAYSILKRRYA